jgi:hypothetical protein
MASAYGARVPPGGPAATSAGRLRQGSSELAVNAAAWWWLDPAGLP